MHAMAKWHITITNLVAIVLTVLVLAFVAPASGADSNGTYTMKDIIPEVEITLSNDGLYNVWYMCQMTDKSDSLYELPANSTYRFKFPHIAFPMRWCYLYINPRSQGFFWVYTVRSRCTKCFWSINRHPSLYRNDKGRWERQKLFMPPRFNISDFLMTSGPGS